MLRELRVCVYRQCVCDPGVMSVYCDNHVTIIAAKKTKQNVYQQRVIMILLFITRATKAIFCICVSLCLSIDLQNN